MVAGEKGRLADRSSHTNYVSSSVESQVTSKFLLLPSRSEGSNGGRRPDEGCGHQRRRGQPLTPALLPLLRKGRGRRQVACAWVQPDFNGRWYH